MEVCFVAVKLASWERITQLVNDSVTMRYACDQISKLKRLEQKNEVDIEGGISTRRCPSSLEERSEGQFSLVPVAITT